MASTEHLPLPPTEFMSALLWLTSRDHVRLELDNGRFAYVACNSHIGDDELQIFPSDACTVFCWLRSAIGDPALRGERLNAFVHALHDLPLADRLMMSDWTRTQ